MSPADKNDPRTELDSDTLSVLFEQFVQHEGESVTNFRTWPDSTGGMIETNGRILFYRDDPSFLLIGRELWVAGLAVFEREDLALPGRRETDVVALTREGEYLYLNDPATVAKMGALVRAEELDATAYAEILVAYHPWAVARHQLIENQDDLDPLGIPNAPQVAPLAVTTGEYGIYLEFFSVLAYATTFGASVRCTVYRWRVDLPEGAPATWRRDPLLQDFEVRRAG